VKLYFAYGANLSHDSMAYRCPHAQPFQSFHLRGWELAFATHADGMIGMVGSVQGALWRISDECEMNLDAFEGYPHYYSKRILAQDGYEFMVYVMNQPQYGSTYWSYVDLIAQGYQDWNLDTEPLWQQVDQILLPAYNEKEQWTKLPEKDSVPF